MPAPERARTRLLETEGLPIMGVLLALVIVFMIAAQRLLETTALAVEDIADRIGMGSAANLRHHFRACQQTTPTHYRRTFGGA